MKPAVSYKRSSSLVLSALVLCLAQACAPTGSKPAKKPSAALEASDYILLVPDFRNDVVHRFGLDGTYEGEFLGPSQFEAHKLAEGIWSSPRALLLLANDPQTFWLANVHVVTAWDGAGKFMKTVFKDTPAMETPVCMEQIGENIALVSEDKHAVLVLGVDGTVVRTISSQDFGRATDCKVGADGLLYVSSRLDAPEHTGLISIWDVSKEPTEDAPRASDYRIAPEQGEQGTTWISGLAFDDNGDFLVAEFAHGRVERWNAKTNTKSEVLLDGAAPATYKEINRGPDGLVYVAGNKGIFRFAASAHASDLLDIKPFFDASTIAMRYKQEFSPSAIVFVPRSALTASTEPQN